MESVAPRQALPAVAQAPVTTTRPTLAVAPPRLVRAAVAVSAPALATWLMVLAWAMAFGYLSVLRHLAGGSHAEDLGFTDQVVWNSLRGQWFRMSIYATDPGASWNTELDLSHIARPDSLLAFHVEPMLLAFVPLYALGAGAVALLIIQSAALAAGALPAFSLARHLSQSAMCGLAVAAAYLLSPFGQWAVLSDFHTSALAAPLLLLSLQRLIVARSPKQALAIAACAATAREDVGPVLACIGIALLAAAALAARRKRAVAALAPWVGAAYLGLGLAWTVFSLLVLRAYSGGISPFEVRYGPTLGSGVGAALAALVRPTVLGYASTLLLSGGWLAVLAPLAVLPALPSLALNALSTSAWMASGQAHYSVLVLPFLALGAAAGLGYLRPHLRIQRGAAAALALGAVAAYVTAGAGPFAANYSPGVLTHHAARADAIAAELPATAAVSASSSLVPRLSHRARAYLFPTIRDSDYVYLDLTASPAPTSAGDVYLRVQNLLASGDWHILQDDDGLLLLQRGAANGSPPADDEAGAGSNSVLRTTTVQGHAPAPGAPGEMHPPQLISATLDPSPDASIDVDGPRWILRTVWQTSQPLPPGTRLEFAIDLRSGERLHVWDIAPLWWNPPDQWPTNQPVTIDVPDVPVREFVSWSATWSR